MVNEFRQFIVSLAREGKPTAEAKLSLQTCESALAALVEQEDGIRKALRERYRYPKKPKK